MLLQDKGFNILLRSSSRSAPPSDDYRRPPAKLKKIHTLKN